MARHALVTGAAGDIDRAICGALAADGWSLFITEHPVRERALQAAREARASWGVETVPALFDVTDEGTVVASVERITARHRTPRAVVANAGIEGDFALVHE